MQQWENKRRLHILKEKVRTAKSIVAKDCKQLYSHNISPSVQRNYQMNHVGRLEFAELLKKFSLQQYSRQLSLRGYEQNPEELAKLKKQQQQDLKSQLRLLPGHGMKLDELIDTLKQRIKQNSYNRVNSYQNHMLKLPQLYRESPMPLLVYRDDTINVSSMRHKKKMSENKSEVLIDSRVHAEVDLKSNHIFTKKSKVVKDLSNFTDRVRILPSLKKFVEAKNQSEIQLQTATIKQMYKSLNGAMMSSTITKMDIEQLTTGVSEYLLSVMVIEKISSKEKTLIKKNQQILNRLSKTTKQETKQTEDSLLSQQEIEYYEDYMFKECSKIDQMNLPSREFLANFIKNIMTSLKLQLQTLLISLVYIDKFIEVGKYRFSNLTYRRVIFITLLLANKILQNELTEVVSFSKVFTDFSMALIRVLEKIFVETVEYRLVVTQQEYANVFFKIRSKGDQTKSHNLKLISVAQILGLERKLKTSSRKKSF